MAISQISKIHVGCYVHLLCVCLMIIHFSFTQAKSPVTERHVSQSKSPMRSPPRTSPIPRTPSPGGFSSSANSDMDFEDTPIKANVDVNAIIQKLGDSDSDKEATGSKKDQKTAGDDEKAAVSGSKEDQKPEMSAVKNQKETTELDYKEFLKEAEKEPSKTEAGITEKDVGKSESIDKSSEREPLLSSFKPEPMRRDSSDTDSKLTMSSWKKEKKHDQHANRKLSIKPEDDRKWVEFKGFRVRKSEKKKLKHRVPKLKLHKCDSIVKKFERSKAERRSFDWSAYNRKQSSKPGKSRAFISSSSSSSDAPSSRDNSVARDSATRESSVAKDIKSGRSTRESSVTRGDTKRRVSSDSREIEDVPKVKTEVTKVKEEVKVKQESSSDYGQKEREKKEHHKKDHDRHREHERQKQKERERKEKV